MIEKPMLAATVKAKDLESVGWPVLASPKLDGIRCLNHPELGAVTRSFKAVPNEYIRKCLKTLCGETPLDGELVAVDEDDNPLTFNQTQSAVMSRSGAPRFVYCVFDCMYFPEDAFADRLKGAERVVNEIDHPYINFVAHLEVEDAERFTEVAEQFLAAEYEGTMLRDPEGPYKNGRSTLKQGWLLKYKEWADAEGVVIGFEEKMHNVNEDIKDEFGYAKRTSHKEGLVAAGTLGALVLETSWGELRVGTGFDDTLRAEIWAEQEFHLGAQVTFKYQAFGMQDKPRFPVFMHFREDE